MTLTILLNPWETFLFNPWETFLLYCNIIVLSSYNHKFWQIIQGSCNSQHWGKFLSFTDGHLSRFLGVDTFGKGRPGKVVLATVASPPPSHRPCIGQVSPCGAHPWLIILPSIHTQTHSRVRVTVLTNGHHHQLHFCRRQHLVSKPSSAGPTSCLPTEEEAKW